METIQTEAAVIDNNKTVGIQVVPVIHHADHTDVQLEGPTEQTSAWGVYRRLANGKASWVKDEPNEADADHIAQILAKQHNVEIEPKPWVI